MVAPSLLSHVLKQSANRNDDDSADECLSNSTSTSISMGVGAGVGVIANDIKAPQADSNMQHALTANDELQQQQKKADLEPDSRAALEARVQDLELKLATISLLLQQQRRNPSRTISPSLTPPLSPKSDEHRRATPALDSPAPSEMHMTSSNNLSFRVLYGQDAQPAASPPLYMPVEADLHLHSDGANQPLRTPLDQIAEQTAYHLNGDDDKSDSLIGARTNKASSPSSLSAGTHHFKAASPAFKDAAASPAAIRKGNTASTSTSNAARRGRTRSDSMNIVDIRSKWLDYLNSFQESTNDVDRQMEEFIKVPGAVEVLLNYGFWICVDSFLYVLTILPIRFVWSCLLLVNHLLAQMLNWKSAYEGPFRFHRRHVYQLIQVGIIYSVYKYVLMPVSIGKLYHWIRGQSMVKLYVLIAIVEVFDRLMCSLGQDCLDSLYWNTTRRPKSSRMAISIAVVLMYTTVHSCLLFIHVATLNVAMNSADQALLTLLISGNFAEIKSTVFKKYNKPNLFKITASDICERFKLALFLSLVLILNISQGMDPPMVWSYIQMCGVVWCAEWLADWIKHSFITKFNFIHSSIYPEYALLLAGDVTGFGHEGVNMDHSHAVVRRIGLAQLPLVCVMGRYVKEAIKYASDSDMIPLNWKLGVGLFVIWAIVLAWKMSLGSFLHRISRAKLKAAPALSKSTSFASKKNK